MIYQGKAITVKRLSDGDDGVEGIGGVAELHFNLEGESVNKFNKVTLEDLKAAAAALEGESGITGLIVTSGKECFIVGADITEFTSLFDAPEDELASWALEANKIFCAIEDLPYPTVTAINGIALGGGLEMCLCTDYRVMSTKAQVGLPEVKLGIFPGFGGTVRMPRLIGVDNAVEWIAAGAQNKPEKALSDGVVDAVVAPEALRKAALSLVKECIEGKVDYKAKREEKLQPLKLPPMENMMSFQTCTAMVSQKAGKHYPAPVAAIKTMQKHGGMKRDQALEVESKGFAKMAKTDVAANLVGLFLNDQALKKNSSTIEKKARDVNQAAVLGAGIMGGGIAYQSASKGTPIIMKDINDAALDLGMSEASKLLAKRVDRKKMTALEMGKTLSKIRPTLNYGDFGQVDIVIEAVVENPKIKKSVLAETEKSLKEGAILASNTSTISITELATALEKPENFVGMHFFNPVHRMPLVEVIRGEKSSEEAVATTVKLARKMGKTPVVVNDCPGFLVNRVLFPYFGGFSMMLRDGADFQAIDKVMEKRYGWPMGPAYLCDVVGIDTCVHAAGVMAEGFPERMQHDFKDAIKVMFENERYGQKNKVGFYKYEQDKKGKPKKVVDEATFELLKEVSTENKSYEEDDIINRLMIPMCLETVRCLEEGIVESPADADMALIMGLGFPPFRGGVFRYIDSIGTKAFVELCDQYKALGSLYEPTEKLREMAKTNETFYS